MISKPDGNRSLRRGFALCVGLLCLLPAAASLAAADVSAQLKTARDALARGDGIAAEVALRQALDAGAERSVIAASMGEAKMLQGNLALARNWLAPGQFASGDQAYGFRMLGQIEMEEGNLATASLAFERALRIDPDSAALWVDIGQLRYRAGEQVQAIAAVHQAVLLDPGNVAALSFQGQIVRDAVGPVAALPWFARAHLLAPKNTEVLFHYASTLGEVGRAKDMLAVTRMMIGLEPRNPRAFYLQAVLAARAGNVDLARRLMVRAGDPLRDVSSAILLNGVLEYRAGNFGTATALFERLWQRQPDNRMAPLLLARTLYQAGRMREVVARFAPMAQGEGASPYLLTLVGRAYEALGERGKASAFLDRAAAPQQVSRLVPISTGLPAAVLESRWRADPGRADNAIPMIRQLIADGEGARAATLANQIVVRFPGAADVHVLAGDAHMANAAYAVALQHYRQAAEVRFTRLLLARMVTALARSGDEAQTVVLIHDYLREHPLDGQVADWAADLAARKGDTKGAMDLYAHAFAVGTAGHDPGSRAQYAFLALQVGDAGTARRNAVQAYRMQRLNGELAFVAGRVLWESDGEGNAVAQALLDKAARIAGEH